jgi:pectate lyase
MAAGGTTPVDPPELDEEGCPVPQLIGYATTGSGTTGGGDSAPTVVTSAGDLRDALSGGDARVVHVSGTIDAGDSSVEIESNKTLRGVDRDATIVGGLTVSGSNVIVQNLTIQGKGEGGSPADAINGTGSNIWFDHLNVLEGGDGLLDLVNGADRITTSWNKFWYTDPDHGHRLSLLFGNDSEKCDLDGGRQHHTIHHNWFADLVRSRAPRLYFGRGHIFNNYYNPPGNNYCIGVGTWASVLIENNYFKDVNNPHQYQDDEYPVYIEAVGNVYDNTSGDQVTGPSSGVGQPLPERFEGSDCHAALPHPEPFTPPYGYFADAAEDVPDLVQRCAGPR